MTPQEIHNKLKEKFGDRILDFKGDVPNPWIRIEPSAAADITLFLRDDPALAFDFLMCLSGLDWPEKGKQEVVYHLFSMSLRHMIVLRAELPRENPKIPSVERIWPAANWHEREAFDLFGIVFEGHSDMRRILLPEDWEGHPLRKDYKVQKSYHGIRVMNPPGKGDRQLFNEVSDKKREKK